MGLTPAVFGQASSKVLRIAATSDLAPALPALAQTYERQMGVKVQVVLGSSAKQVARIEAGEPADLFLGSDFTFPEKLVADGLTDAKAPVAYAKGTLVLFSRRDSALQPLNLERLSDPHLQKLSIPNTLNDPIGRAGAAALAHLKLMVRLQPNFVVTDDATEAIEAVEKGQVQAALTSLTLARSDHFRQIGTFILVPQSQYPEMKEYFVVLRKGDTAAAHRFLDWLLSPGIQEKLPNLGLDAVR